MSRLTIDITQQQHQNLKVMAALQGKTIKQYTIERLFSGYNDDEQAWKELKTLLNKRVHDGLSGKISTKSIKEIIDEEMSGAYS